METARSTVPTVEELSSRIHELDKKMKRISALCSAVLTTAFSLAGSGPEVENVQVLAEMAQESADSASASSRELAALTDARIAALYTQRSA